MLRLAALLLLLGALATGAGASESPDLRSFSPQFSKRLVLRPLYTQLTADGPWAAALGYDDGCLGIAWRPGSRLQSFETCANVGNAEGGGTTELAVGGTRITWLAYVFTSHGTYDDWQLWERDVRTRRSRELASSYTSGGFGITLQELVGGGSLFAFATSDSDIGTEVDTTYLLPGSSTAPGTMRCPGESGVVAEPPPANRCVRLPDNYLLLDVYGGRALAWDANTRKLVILGADASPQSGYFPISIANSTAALTGPAIVVLRKDVGQVEAYDTATGNRTAAWPVPGAHVLWDATGAYVLYSAGALHVLRLRDGADARLSVRGQLRLGGAQLTPAGLFYLYRARVRGRLRDVLGFEPLARLDRQLTALTR